MKYPKASALAAALLSLTSAFLAPGAAHARTSTTGAGHGAGIGVIFGEPTGVTGKVWTHSDRAIDAGLAFSFNSFFLLYGDYDFHFPGAFGHTSTFASQLSPYVGIGGMLFFSTTSNRTTQTYFNTTSSSVGLGIRVPLGIEWLPGDPPIGVFVELVPGIGIVPGTFGFFQGGIGVRYYF